MTKFYYNKYYWYFALSRILIVFLPWVGYIHPDEYFQSIEVIGGNFLKVESKLTWEFNNTSPIRSIALPYFTLGISFKLLLGIDYFLRTFLSSTVFTSYFALLLPRLFMCLSSFIIDYSFYKICRNNNERCNSRIIVLSSSYIVFTFATRTFSNSFELLFFALLLYYVSESLTFSNQILRKKEYVQYRYSKTESIPERAKFHKLNLYLKTDTLRNCLQISTVVVVGFFNRPTFLAYSFVPVFFWLYRGIGSRVISNVHFHIRILALILCAIPCLSFIILVDSFYYGYISWGEIGMLDVSINSFVFTPLNFVKYNVNAKNLAEHGLHPRYLHVLVTMPLLFNMLAFFHFYNLAKYFHRLTQGKFNLLPTVRSIKGLMTLSAVTPLALLSTIPHQEPRFLIPLLLPMVYLYGMNVLPEKEVGIVKVDPNTLRSNSVTSASKVLYVLWLATNFVLVLFYGHLHQAGVVPALSHLSKAVKKSDRSVEIHLFSSHNYMLPQYLLIERKPQLKIEEFIPDVHAYNKRILVHEEGTRELKVLARNIGDALNVKKKLLGKRLKLYLLLPLVLRHNLSEELKRTNLTVVGETHFFPHVSIEALSSVGDFHLDLIGMMSYETLCDVENFAKVVGRIGDLLSLGLYEIE